MEEVESRFKDVFASAVKLGAIAEVEPRNPRVCGKQTQRVNEPGTGGKS